MHAPESPPPPTRLETVDSALRDGNPNDAVDRLIEVLDREGSPRELLDALLLKARVELGLPSVQTGSLAELPEPARSRYEDRYVEAIRRVGSKLLEAGDIPGAWPYFRAIAEKEPVAEALESFTPPEESTQADADRLSQVIEIAFNQGAHPTRGFTLILENYGICSSITAFEHLPPENAVRVPCVELLIRTLHDHLGQSLRAEIVRQGEPEPAESTTIPDLMAGRDWLFAEDAYHIDVSHLGAVVRYAPLASDPEALRKAVDLAEYGRHLSERYRQEGEPPFEDTYGDHAVYLRALLGEDADAAVAHFRTKLQPPDPDGPAPRPCRHRSSSVCSNVWDGSTRPSTSRPSIWAASRTRCCSAPLWPVSANRPDGLTAWPGSLGTGTIRSRTSRRSCRKRARRPPDPPSAAPKVHSCRVARLAAGPTGEPPADCRWKARLDLSQPYLTSGTIMPPSSRIDAREVDRVDALMTTLDDAQAEAFLNRCVPGSTWTAFIRTAEVAATVIHRTPLGMFDERVCTCVRLRLELPVPVEPRLRFRIVADDGSGLEAAGMVRPWAS